MIFTFVGTLLILLGGILPFLKELKENKGKMNKSFIFSLLIFICSAIGGIFVTVGQNQSSQADKDDIIKNIKIENSKLKVERDKLSDTLEVRNKRIQEQNQNIETLSKKLVKKSEYIENFIIGETRFPHVELSKI